MLEWFEQDHEEDHSPQKQEEWAAVVSAFGGRVDPRKDWVRSQCPMCVELEGKDDYKRRTGKSTDFWDGMMNCFADVCTPSTDWVVG